MPLATDTVRPRLLNTTTVSVTATTSIYVDVARGYQVVDKYATINAVVRLLERLLIKPVSLGSTHRSEITQIVYVPSTYVKPDGFQGNYLTAGVLAGSVYDPTSLATATAAPFTIPATALNTLNTAPDAINIDSLQTFYGAVRS